MVLEDRPLLQDEVPPIVRTNVVAPGYFESMGIGLLEGRYIERQDHERVTNVAVVSRTLAEQYWPSESALGKRVAPNLPNDADPQWVTIVGVVDDIRDDGLTLAAPEMIYYPLVLGGEAQLPATRLFLTIRTAGEPLAALPAIRNEIWSLDDRLPIANVGTAADLVRDAAARTSFALIMLGIASAVALLLGTIGVYGVISYIVSQRIREFGIRLAMGARVSQIRRMVVEQGLRVAAVGVAIGVLGGLALTRLMRALLFGVSATDPFTFLAVAAILVVVSAAAAYVPARRASRVSPASALRHE